MKKTVLDWLDYMLNIHVSAIDMDLSRVTPVADYLQLHASTQKSHVFTVAGTNGKGSTTAVIAEICQQAGYKTALYQSPHLIDFNERIKINGKAVTDEVLIAAFEQVEAARIACQLTLSFFEMTTLAAFVIFAEANCDVWVLEVGLGGRLDVVNIIDPNVAVITNIDIDHTDWLGTDIEQIGFEKAGILRPNIPFVYGSRQMPESIQSHAKKLSASCYQLGVDFDYRHHNHNHNHNTEFNLDDDGCAQNNCSNGMQQNTKSVQPTGSQSTKWQYSNAATTLSFNTPKLALLNAANAITATLISALNINQDAINRALASVSLIGRFDKRQLHNRQWLFDVAHNTAGVDFLVQQLTPMLSKFTISSTQSQTNIHIILSMLEDKDIDNVVSLLNTRLASAYSSYWHIAALDNTHCPRAASLAKLTEVFDQQGISYNSHENLPSACDAVIKQSTTDDLILVCGSFHTIKECLTHLN